MEVAGSVEGSIHHAAADPTEIVGVGAGEAGFALVQTETCSRRLNEAHAPNTVEGSAAIDNG